MVLIKKFGGKLLSNPDNIKLVAKYISQVYKTNKKIIVVVSAMGQTTDELEILSKQITSKPNPRELDMLLSAGERISMSLLSMAIQELGCPAISFTGSQAGILTEGHHNDSTIIDIKPTRVTEELNKNKVIVIAGYQGVNPSTKEVTTLGRGGSDTSAVCLSSNFESEYCHVIKDVDGLYSWDPKILDSAKFIPRLDFDTMYTLCNLGCKLLHYKSIAMAKKLNAPIRIQSLKNTNSTLATNVTDTCSLKLGSTIALTQINLTQINNLQADSETLTFLNSIPADTEHLLIIHFYKKINTSFVDRAVDQLMDCNIYKDNFTFKNAVGFTVSDKNSLQALNILSNLI